MVNCPFWNITANFAWMRRLNTKVQRNEGSKKPMVCDLWPFDPLSLGVEITS
jgi:hypothetical protein